VSDTVLISDPSDPRLRDYANLTDAQLRDADWAGTRGVFIAEGELIVRRLVGSRFPVRSLLSSPQGLERIKDLTDTLARGVPVFVAQPAVLADIVGFPFHRGILACGERLPPRPLDDVLRARVVVVLENLSNSDNVGAVFRNMGSLVGDLGAVLLSPGCCDPLYRKALRVSMGQALLLPFARLDHWPGDLARLAAAGFQVLALTPDPQATSIHDLRLPPGSKVALLLGAEGPGLTEAAFGRADLRIRIPMAAGADSLNVATAGAVALAVLGR
jgi:tRNA G18 (ribose-2'-O)-methylase SpoU